MCDARSFLYLIAWAKCGMGRGGQRVCKGSEGQLHCFALPVLKVLHGNFFTHSDYVDLLISKLLECFVVFLFQLLACFYIITYVHIFMSFIKFLM